MLLGPPAHCRDRAALATPAAPSLVVPLFPPGPEQTGGVGHGGALSGLSSAVKILLGGAIIEAASWR
jgi:hypothetical protein